MAPPYLVLDRKAGETVILKIMDSNGSVTEVKVDVLSKKNRLGFSVPSNVTVLREELIEA